MRWISTRSPRLSITDDSSMATSGRLKRSSVFRKGAEKSRTDQGSRRKNQRASTTRHSVSATICAP